MLKVRHNPIPTYDDLGLRNSAGFIKAEVIRLSAERFSPCEIQEIFSDWVSLGQVEACVGDDRERIEMYRGLDAEHGRAYLNGVALKHNQDVMDRRLVRHRHATTGTSSQSKRKGHLTFVGI